MHIRQIAPNELGLDMAAAFANEFFAGAQQAAQFLRLGIGHKAAADQAWERRWRTEKKSPREEVSLRVFYRPAADPP
jgi:hypothetical protein